MNKESSLWQQYLDMRAKNVEQLPSFWGEMAALWREARKDINSQMHQVFFGQPTGFGEPGTPLVPTQAMVTKSIGTVHGYGAKLDDAAAHGFFQQQQEKGMER